MTDCETEVVGQEGGKFLHKCKLCGREYRSRYRDPASLHTSCPVKARPEYQQGVVLAELPADTRDEFTAQATARGMLLGDYIAAMTKAIGIPTCGGCEKRRQWLNRVHAWLRGDEA